MTTLLDERGLRPTELPEYPIIGPFGGIQSEVPPDLIGQLGFEDCQNVILRKARATVRPGFTSLTALPAPSNEAIVGIFDFFDSGGTRVYGAWTPTRLLQWNGAWTEITHATLGAASLTGSPNQSMHWTVVNEKLIFSQGVDRVMLWDGITATFDFAFATVVTAKYMIELNRHLLMANLVDAATTKNSRVRWSAAGDPTDVTGFNAGIRDQVVDLGPINGMSKLFQDGYLFHQSGITRVVPTGLGLRPFDWVTLSAGGRGNIASNSLASVGEHVSMYVGQDNIYLFDGTQSVGVGDAPLADTRFRVGAKKKIVADLLQANLNQVIGFMTTSINGNDFLAYWLCIPGGSVWIFNLDEENWTRFTYANKPKSFGIFSTFTALRIIDLVGSIADQQWRFSDISGNNPLDSLLIGFDQGTPGLVDFTNFSEETWKIASGKLTLGDRRHEKTVTKFKLIVHDIGSATYNITFRNEKGQSETKSVTLGSGTNAPIVEVVPFQINGFFLEWEITGAAAQPASFVEFSPIYDTGREVVGSGQF